MNYTDTHRFLLRLVSSRGVLSVSEAEEILNTYNTDDNGGSLKNMISDINKEIKGFQQTIKLTTDEVTEEQVLVFLFLGFDDTSKAQNFFTANELEFFRLLLEEIMTTERREISGIYAMNLVGRMKSSFTKSDAEKLLTTWCRMRYLDKNASNYALGVRAIHEFETYLRKNMPDTIEECSLCKQIVFRGCNCPICGLAVHTRCLDRYLNKVNKWPCCKNDYDAAQLAGNNHSQRLSQTQGPQSEMSPAYETIAEDETSQQSTEDVELSQDIVPGVLQCITRKRKRL